MSLIKDVKELENLLNIRLTKKQKKVFNRKELYVLWGGSMSSGKSFLASFMALYYALGHDGATCLIGRKFYISLTKTTAISFENLLRKLPKGWLIRHNKTEGYYEFKNGSRVYFVGLADSFESLDKIRGMELIFAAIDECQDLDNNSAFKMIAGRLRQRIKGVKPKMLLTCNPTRKKWLIDLFINHRKRDFYFLKAFPKDNPHLPEDYIRNQKKVLSDIEFKILILGSWEDAQIEDCLFSKEKIDEVVKNKKHVKGSTSYGIDVSLAGTSVVAKKSGNKVTIPVVLKNSNIDELMEKIGKTVKNKNTPIYVDAIGEGAGLAVILEREKYNVIKVRQSELAMDSDKYFNQRAENYDRLNQMLEEGLNLQNDAELINQMLMTKKDFSKDNRIKIESKKALHDRKQSPDKLDAVVLSCIGGGGLEEDEDESELSISINQWSALKSNLSRLKNEMTDIEKNKQISFIKKNEQDFIERGLIKRRWREYRREYDKLIRIWNMVTEKGYGENDIWMLKSRPMGYTYGTPIPHLRERFTGKEDNPNVDVEIRIKGLERTNSRSGEVARGVGRSPGLGGGTLISNEDLFGGKSVKDLNE